MSLQASPMAIVLFVAGFALAWLAALLLWAKLARALDWPAALFVSLISVVILTGWLAVLLASCGVYSLARLAMLLWIGAGVMGWRARPLQLAARGLTRPGRCELALVILLLGCSIVYFRPHEYVLGGTDAGTYMSMGALAARTGHLVEQSEWMRLLGEHAPVTLREQPPTWRTRYLQFVGWYIDDADPSRTLPQFFPFHPMLIAVGISLAGLYGGLLVTPVWGVLSIAAVYFLGRRLFGPAIGLLGAVLLALTPTHIWFARYPTTEPLTLLFVFTGLWAFQVLWDEGDTHPIWGVAGGAALGASLLTRPDLPLLIALIVVALIVRRARAAWSKSWTVFALTWLVFLAYSILSAVTINWPYVWNAYGSALLVLNRLVLPAMGLGLTGLVLIAVAWLAIRRGKGRAWIERGWRRLAECSRSARGPLAALVILMSLYAYFVRPILEPVLYAVSWPGDVQFPVLNGQNWVRLGWYLTPLGLALATLGLAVLVWRESLGRLWFFGGVSVLTIVQYVYNIMNTPYHIYTMRRYVPIALPALMMFAAVALAAVWRLRWKWIGRGLGAALALGLMAGLIYQSRYVLPQRDLYGAVQQLTALNARLKPEAILVISEPSESVFADTFGAPLHFIFGHDVATIRQDGPETLTFIRALQARAVEQRQPVQLIAVNSILPSARVSLALQPVEMFPVTLRMLMNTFWDYPSVIQTAYYGIEIYDVVDQRPPTPGPIDIGAMDAAFIRSGFYDKEFMPGSPTMRWTAGEAALDIPLAAGTPVTVEVRAMIYRPAGVPPADVVVALDGQEIGRFQPDETWRTFAFRGQAQSANGISVLQFKTVTFNPAHLRINADARDLGSLVDWVKLLLP